jgi:hypothetical protein
MLMIREKCNVNDNSRYVSNLITAIISLYPKTMSYFICWPTPFMYMNCETIQQSGEENYWSRKRKVLEE